MSRSTWSYFIYSISFFPYPELIVSLGTCRRNICDLLKVYESNICLDEGILTPKSFGLVVKASVDFDYSGTC